MRKLASLILILFVSTSIFSQELGYVENELIVQLKKGESIISLSDHLSKYDKNWQLESNLISAPMRAYTITFNPNAVSIENLQTALTESKFFQVVQKNHTIKYRSSTPDDPQFSNQWQYLNVGQSGGTPGADIDADLAWDITRGGVTYDGDTIVVCVLDDGIELSHSDFGDNLWVNREEIPNNNIDDDNNGYIDDYLGWSTVTNNDNVSGGSHGSPVAGIVGARGNNGNGVTGVSWHVKVMVVNMGFNTSEAAVLAAYSYPLSMRQRYNNTQGQSGAFVVSTNASWGIDFGQPANAPLWCAFYDTLGAYGILNCGATINGNFNVDLVGDLPTACPSDHLISVTNMNHNDQKVTGAGYGATTIDLGAFGAGTITPQNGNSYGPFGGTSGATPHVAGAIGLLYSLPCAGFMETVKNDPEEAVRKMKSYILDGVDLNPSIAGITVTGGRLNIYNSMLEMITDCDSGFCPVPNNLEVSNVTDNSVDFSWYTHELPIYSEVKFRAVGSTVWTTIIDTSLQVSLTGLVPCVDYEVYVESYCEDSTQNSSEVLTFKTEGCCVAPGNFYVDSTLADGFILSWDSVFAANAYQLKFLDVFNRVKYDTVINTTSGFLVDGLDSCFDYKFRLYTECDTGLSSATPDSTLSTFGCGACTDLSYCTNDPINTTLAWFDSISINQVAYNPGVNQGYSFEENGFILYGNSLNQLSIKPAFANNPSIYSYLLWVDMDHDGLFDDATENLLEFRLTSSGIDTSFFLPNSALEGTTRLRLMMNITASGSPCLRPVAGDVEDFCANIESATSLSEWEILQNSLRVYPNPAENQIFIEDIKLSESEIQLVDPLGKTLLVDIRQKGKDVFLDTSNLVSGLYILQVSKGKEVHIEKVIIEK